MIEVVNLNQMQMMTALIKRCQASAIFFIENFCKVKHQKAGILPFSLFSYQRRSLVDFLKNRFVVYKKTRQCGISTLSGAFALWYAMFFPHKTILIVSKRDLDAKEFLAKNVKFPYDNLPQEFKDLWGDPPPTYNEHHIIFPNGSSIKSLTCGKDTLRANASSLNLIDESGFIPCMDAMWAGGASTVMHGGTTIVISTTNGVGNWYHSTWQDAVENKNNFHPIKVDWWDMDWELSYKDELSGNTVKISPRAGIRKCESKEEIDKWGPWWSPWLEEQYRILQSRGEENKFRQEVLAEFLGTGNSVLPPDRLKNIQKTIKDDYQVVNEVDYTNPVTGDEFKLYFENQLRIWHKPVRPEPPEIENGRIIKPAKPGHVYSVGVDISSGEADDYSAIEVIDCNAMHQVAELNIKVMPKQLIYMVDYIARWYNNAFVVPERTGLGIPVCQSLYSDIGYANLFRMRLPTGKLSKKIGFPTSPTYKPQLNKAILDNLGHDEEDEGVVIYSSRLWQQLTIYVHFGNNRTGHVDGPGNHSDLSIAMGLALVGIMDAVQGEPTSLIPTQGSDQSEPILESQKKLDDMRNAGGLNVLMPFITAPQLSISMSPDDELRKFTNQLGGVPLGSKTATQQAFVTKRKNVINYPK
jgi:hypothetical protein